MHVRVQYYVLQMYQRKIITYGLVLVRVFDMQDDMKYLKIKFILYLIDNINLFSIKSNINLIDNIIPTYFVLLFLRVCLIWDFLCVFL